MATRSKYTRAKQEEQKQDKPDTDILMRFCPSYGRYVSRALTLFFGEGKTFVTIKAADRLIDRALWVAQVLKHRVAGLHQITQIKEREVVDIYEPKEEGLVRVEQRRFLTIVEVTLTLEPTANQKKAPGYQSPIQAKGEEFLTKETWEKQAAERKEKIASRGQRKEGDERRNENRRENRRENRGEQRTRGRN